MRTISVQIENTLAQVDLDQTCPQVDVEIDTSELEAIVDTDFLEDVSAYGFNLHSFAEKTKRELVLPSIGLGCLKINGLEQSVDVNKYVAWTQQLQSKYHQDVSYHNDLHGSDTAQHVSFLLQKQDFAKIMRFNEVDKLSILVACLGHDVGHDGFSNGFHKNTNSARKQLFGESHIQEYYHAAQTLQILNNPEFDFISDNFSKDEVR